MDGETVIHRVQQKHTLVFASGGDGCSPVWLLRRDDQAIIAHRHLRSRVHAGNDFVFGVDLLSQMSSQNVQTWKLGAMRRMPVGSFATDKIRQAAYAEVGIVVRNQNRELRRQALVPGRGARRLFRRRFRQ